MYISAQLSIGNTLPLGSMPEGTIVCALEEKPGDRGKIAKASGNYCTIISHNPDTNRSRVKLPSGSKKVLIWLQVCVKGVCHFNIITDVAEWMSCYSGCGRWRRKNRQTIT